MHLEHRAHQDRLSVRSDPVDERLGVRDIEDAAIVLVRRVRRVEIDPDDAFHVVPIRGGHAQVRVRASALRAARIRSLAAIRSAAWHRVSDRRHDHAGGATEPPWMSWWDKAAGSAADARNAPIHAVAPVPTTSMTTASPFPSERTTRHPEVFAVAGRRMITSGEDLAELRGQAHLIRSLLLRADPQ